MAVDRKRKARTSRSRFGLWPSNKVIIIDGDMQSKTRDDTRASSSDPAGGNNSEKDGSGSDGFRGRLRRNSTRLLSMLGFWNSANKTSNECPDPSESAVSSSSQLSQEHLLPSEESPCAAPSGQTPAGDDALLSRTPSVDTSRSSNPEKEKTKNQNLEGVHSSTDCNLPCGIRRSHTTPGLARRLSQKLSTFGHPTVIHRTNVRSRPSIPNIDGSASLTSLSKQCDNTQDSSDPSTPNSGSDSPAFSQSTNPTSSDGVSRSPKISKPQALSPGNRSWSFSIWSREAGTPAQKLVPIRENPVIPSPSIVTVEATATAKIFFETHFNSIFSGTDPRSQRLRELEDRLHVLPVSAEERLQARKAWLAQESEYLRQSRVLKTRSNCIRHLESVSIAGYEVIRVLGKGSFGVVRLVKEKKESQEVCDSAIAASGGKQKDVSVLKHATSGARQPRRSDVTKMKKEVFAMKVIRKSDMLRNCQEGHLRAERDFLVASEKSQWIVPLIASFQDTNYLYLVMDYMVGGDFLGLLIRKNILSEDVTRWYVAEMVLCVEEAHRLGWIHRDVKPDNFLISASGHLKISDFGLAFDGHWTHDQAYFNNQRHSLLKKLGITVEGDSEDRKEAKTAPDKQSRPLAGQAGVRDDDLREPKDGVHILDWRNHKERRRLAKSIVGTSQYMAPEVIRGELYDGRCDWWSVGIILYECLYGFTPFACENRHDTKIRILQHPRTLYFPVDKPSDKLVSVEAIDLISRILQEKENRLCSSKYKVNDLLQQKKAPGELASTDFKGFYVYPNDASDIKAHPFFDGIKWNELIYRRPPFVPKVKSWEDTKYFEEDEPISDIKDTSTGSNVSPPAPAPEPQGDVTMADVADIQPEAEASRDAGKEDLISAHDQEPAKVDTPAKFPVKVHKRKKEKKRPRDKILRDEVVGKTVLDLRKKGAFLGYTYRRPRAVMLALETERGRSLVAW